MKDIKEIKLEFPKKYKAQEVEYKWQEYWQENKIYKWDESETRENTYVIDTPPPTVSGMLHMGHVFSYVQADFIARFQRMNGKTVFYPMGFDDNGLPTERLVEKVKKVKGSRLPRSEFVEMCKEVVVSAEEDFRALFNSIALSVDWDEEYQTISDDTRKISQMSFLDLYEKGLMERKFEPCYWDVTDQTALSQADIEDKELPGFMNDIEFEIEGEDRKLTIATTRPELIPACVAVFVHPEDERFKDLIGKNAVTAIFKSKVPILADDMVAQDKGTGAVMCCTFGDMTDVLWWKKHGLNSRVIINKYGKIKDFMNSSSDDYDEKLVNDLKENSDFNVFEKLYRDLVGKKIKDAKEKVLELVKNDNLLTKQEGISHAVKCAERSGTPIEIILTKQWFIKILEKKKELLARSAEANWYPPYMKNRMDQWIEGLSYDWCISRQRFFGVPFPVWYVRDIKANKIEIKVAGKEDLPIDPLSVLPKGYNLVKNLEEGIFEAEKDGVSYEIIAEKDVMDTWATSSVSPQISSKAINEDYAVDINRHKKLFPADLRPQAHEIIRSWAFYTVAKAHLHENSLPWKDLMISGWCLASDKTKMSKSKGNVVTPVNLITEKSSDVVRFWASTSHLGSDTAYSEDVLSVGKKLTNKLWNAAKFSNLHIENIKDVKTVKELVKEGIINQTADLWLLSKLEETIRKASVEFEKYEYAKAREYVENFFWNYYCDNYLELAKARSYGDKENLINYNSKIKDEEIESGRLSAAYTIYHSFNVILKLFAPFLPHITEEIFTIMYVEEHKKLNSIHARNSWPEPKDFIFDQAKLAEGDKIIEILDMVRKEKSDQNFSLKKEVEELEIFYNQGLQSFSKDILFDLSTVSNAKKISLKNEEQSEVSIKLKFVG